MSTRVIGKPRRRVDGRAKVTGQTRFADDLIVPRMLHGRLLRSPHPHARIVRVDTSEAEAMPGVVAVLTGKEMPTPFGILPVSEDEHALCVDRVRFVGELDQAVVIAAGLRLDARGADAHRHIRTHGRRGMRNL